MSHYERKYLKYKKKYLQLKGGSNLELINMVTDPKLMHYSIQYENYNIQHLQF